MRYRGCQIQYSDVFILVPKIMCGNKQGVDLWRALPQMSPDLYPARAPSMTKV